MFEANLKFSDGSERGLYDRVATVREKSGKNKRFSRSGNFVKGQGKSNKSVKVSKKSENYIFWLKASWKLIDLGDVCRNSTFDQWFSVFSFFFYHSLS